MDLSTPDDSSFKLRVIDPLIFAIDENDNEKFHRIVNALHLSVYSSDKLVKASETKKITKAEMQVNTIKPTWLLNSCGLGPRQLSMHEVLRMFSRIP